MNNLRVKQIVEVKNLFNEFTMRVNADLSRLLDSNPKDFKFTQADIIENDIPGSHLTDDNYVFRSQLTYEDFTIPLWIIISGKILLSLADIRTGGSGKIAYKGALSEKELNTAFELLSNLLMPIQKTIFERHGKEIEFKPLKLEQMNSIYNGDEEYKRFNFSIKYELAMFKELNFDIFVSLNEDDICNILEKMRLLTCEEIINTEKKPEKNLHYINDVKIHITAELGKTKIPIKTALELARNSVVTLDTISGENIILYANDVKLAEAEIVTVDNHFGVRITKIFKKEEL